MKDSVWRTRIPIWKQGLTLVITDDLNKWADKIGCEPMETYHGAFHSCKDTEDDNIHYIVVNSKWARIPLIQHEIDHATHSTLRIVGIVECEESEEAYTYTNEWVTKWVMNQLKKLPITPNPGKSSTSSASETSGPRTSALPSNSSKSNARKVTRS